MKEFPFVDLHKEDINRKVKDLDATWMRLPK